ncbi:DUF3445 domain-containing protein [bacterium]|nr:DUF3445 domain-containing protein [bacterium]
MTPHPPILQSRLGVAPWRDPLSARLPGLAPLAPKDWLIRDDAFAAQMAERDRLFASRPAATFAQTEGSEPAGAEALAAIRAHISADPGYRADDDCITRPDGVVVDTSAHPPLLAAARLVQADLVILEARSGVHVLTAAALAFPASWRLADKIGRPMARIHQPINRIDAAMDARIERTFARLPPGLPLMRSNALGYNDPALHQPRAEGEPKPFDPALPVFVRVERQCLLKLAESGAIVFSIHTVQVPLEALDTADRTGFAAHLAQLYRAH